MECRESFTEIFAEEQMTDSGTSFHIITHSADQLSNVRLCNDKVRIGANHPIYIVGYGTVTAVFPRDLTVKLFDVGSAPDFAFNLLLLLAASMR